ncbi:MAG: YitT family protein, partial [Prevotellaceae bacterium]|nr:YitT family protein [Prevotellaceae bacterium]
MQKKHVNILKDYAIMSIGLLIFVFGWVAFIIPNGIVGGGISGIGALIYYATGFEISYSYLLSNILLLMLGVQIIGRHFGAKTIFGILLSTALFHYLPQVVPDSLIAQVRSENNLLLWALVGGIFEGTGVGLVFARGGSTGGTDILALIINKFKHVNPGRVLLYCDIVIIGSSIFLPDRTILSLLYGGIMVAVSTYVIDALLVGSKQSLQVLIFSERYEAIADEVCRVMGRGITMLYAKGWYTKHERNVLLLVVRKYEVNTVYRIIKEIDRDAFVSTASVTGVFGEGFEPIKDGTITLIKRKRGAKIA